MKGKLFLCLILLVFLTVTFAVSWKCFHKEYPKIIEYTPEQEISDEQERQTVVTLYFVDKETKELFPEARLIDTKLLIENPGAVILELLLNGPKNEKLESIIPNGTKLNNLTVEKGVAIVDLSTEFIREIKLGAKEENKMVYSIVNTLVELSEIDSIKILIDGHENTKFDDGEVNFKNIFTKK